MKESLLSYSLLVYLLFHPMVFISLKLVTDVLKMLFVLQMELFVSGLHLSDNVSIPALILLLMYLFLVLVVLCAVVLIPPILVVGANILRTLQILKRASLSELPWVVVFQIALPTNVLEIYLLEDIWVI
jgi:hypothetical protein